MYSETEVGAMTSQSPPEATGNFHSHLPPAAIPEGATGNIGTAILTALLPAGDAILVCTQSLKMGKSLYENRYLLILRAVKIDDLAFIKGFCKASMKRIQYEINIKIHQNGTVEESNCECTAGSGIHAQCKHVATVLYGMVDMLHHKTALLEEVSTQKLQSFHHPKKKYYSTPLKAQNLPNKRIQGNLNFHPYQENINKEKYNEKIRNLVLNFTYSTMPIKQLYRPANPYAVEWDHGSYSIPLKDKILESLYLNNVSSADIKTIEQETRKQSQNVEWHKCRKHRLTASDFYTVCHLRVQTMPSFARNLLFRSSVSTRATNHGKVNEKVALKQYCEKYGLKVKECGLFINKEKPYLGASPDGLLGHETVVEVKCPYSTRFCLINPVTVPYLYQTNGILQIKRNHPYYYQIQGQLYCTNRKYCNLIIYTYKDMQVLYIERDENFIAEMIDKFKKTILKKQFLISTCIDIMPK
ncbi:hypothetical protein ABMA27_016194 [Loxostege sticticalis]|uniref:SWIM-type domain-containing protein n=1 Tax=Loxostege sticticalis TaxID=481309 RepID=A0ABR3I5U9_LOXSC